MRQGNLWFVCVTGLILSDKSVGNEHVKGQIPKIQYFWNKCIHQIITKLKLPSSSYLNFTPIMVSKLPYTLIIATQFSPPFILSMRQKTSPWKPIQYGVACVLLYLLTITWNSPSFFFLIIRRFPCTITPTHHTGKGNIAR